MRAEAEEFTPAGHGTAPSAAMPAATRRLSERQIEAVYAVMRLLRDDEPAADAAAPIVCSACRRGRSSRGSIAYDAYLLCNGCATDYELLSTARKVRTIQEFLHVAGGR